MTGNRDGDSERKPNHLAGQTSPYLLQHLYNPVDWHPWGEEALGRARNEDKPLFVSIGYAACHWCHVMERESFENDDVAALLNRHFVPVKIDREERPDIDEIYMNAVQLMTGQGGWPLNVFLTPDLEPFFGGTYFPPDARYGRPGFPDLLMRVRDAWSAQRQDIVRSAGELTERLKRIASGPIAEGPDRRIGAVEVTRAAAELAARFEPRWGGFGQAPKFPPDASLALLLGEHVRTGEDVPLRMVGKTLDGMALGGMYDHVGGGFARYSVDERWLVPHFEKMLYNQALLVPVYLDVWLVTGKPLYRRVAEQTLDFVRSELTDGGGGFHSSLDADSEGEEGKFYVWTPDEIERVLGVERARNYCETYGITTAGNFEGRGIPNLLDGSLADRAESLQLSEEELVDRLEPARRELLAARERRVRPATDDKILTAWNGLMITAYARAYQALGRDDDLRSAVSAAEFLLEEMLEDGRLRVSHREGQARLNAYLDDYAFLGRGLLDLYESCFDERFLEQAGALAATLVSRFEDRERGGFFFTSDDHESLLTRNRSTHDGAIPAGAGVAAELLFRLAVHLNEPGFRHAAERALAVSRPAVERMPSAHASLLLAATRAECPPREIAIVGRIDDSLTAEFLAVIRGRYRTGIVVQVAPPGRAGKRCALLAGKQQVDGKPSAYLCRDYACGRPTHDPAELARQLGDESP